jgi:phage recombination protein Bet
MENAVAIKEKAEISVADVKKFIAPNATDKELFMFMGISKSFGLNPLKREIHFVKYGNAAASIIVGYEIYLKRAERTGKLDGWKCWIEGDKAVIEIKRKDQSIPIKWEVDRKEFDKQQSTWKAMPNFMLKKVAIAQGFRLAFPDELGGLPYLAEELPQTAKMSSEDLAKDEIIVDAQVMPEEATPTPPVEEVAPQGNVASEDGIDEAFVKIESVDSKEGTTNGKKWKAYFIKTATGGSYGTFSETLADLANTYKEEGKLVRISHKAGKKAGSRELVSIEDDAA